MNNSEREMVKLLVDLRKNYNLVGIKTEFEAEGVHLDEFYRLKEITMLAGLPITLKIGGCEAITDISFGKAIGVSHVIAPMIESSFAVKKFMAATYKCYTDDELEDVIFEINIETITGYNAFEKILDLPEYTKIGGITIGRTDLTHSMGFSTEEMECDVVFSICRDIFMSSKKKYPGKKCTLGGINSFKVIEFLQRFPKKIIDRYETRKTIFSYDGSDHNIKEGLVKGLQFEIMWYKNKKHYYEKISGEDCQYLEITQNKCKKMLEEL
jgi:hypothetical protein